MHIHPSTLEARKVDGLCIGSPKSWWALHWKPKRLMGFSSEAQKVDGLCIGSPRCWWALHWRPKKLTRFALEAQIVDGLCIGSLKRWWVLHWRPKKLMGFALEAQKSPYGILWWDPLQGVPTEMPLFRKPNRTHAHESIVYTASDKSS